MTVSYFDRAVGRRVGLAIVAQGDDTVCLMAARRTLEAWKRNLRSRLLLIAAAGPCAGARRAALLLEHADAQVVSNELDTVSPPGPIAFPAHGVTSGVRAEAAARGLEVVDATCPLAARAHRDVALYAARGDTVVVIGDRSHAAAAVLAGHAPDASVVVETPEQVQGLSGLDPDRVAFVVDPAMTMRRVMPVLAALRDRFPRLSGHHFDVLCHAATDEEHSIDSVLRDADVSLVVAPSGRDKAAGAVLDTGRRLGAAARTVTCVGDVGPDMLAEATTVGLVLAEPSAQPLLRELVAALGGLGPCTVRVRATTTQTGTSVLESEWGLSPTPAHDPEVRSTVGGGVG